MTITPRFEANVGADISGFLRKAQEVSAKIQEMATGVVIDITANINDFMSDANRVQDTINDIDRSVDVTVNANTSDLERAITEANAQIAALNDSATVNINGNNSNFNNAAGNVNRATQSLRRRVTEARIGANIGDFENRMVRVTRALTEADGTVTPRIQLDINEFQNEILTVEDHMRELSRATADPEVEADIAGFMAQMALVQTQLNSVAQIHDIDIRADTGSAHARLSALWLHIRSLTAKDFIIGVQTRWNNFTNIMGSMANFSRSMGEIGGSMARNSMIMVSPAIVPVIASLVGVLGNLGPMLGTIAGSTFAFATALGAAGLGIGGFAAVAIPTIKDLFAMDEAIKRGSSEWNNLSQESRTAINSIDEFQGNWGAFREVMDKPVTTAFTDFMQASNKLLDLFKPAIEGSVAAVGNLMKSLEAAAGGEQVKSFFEWLGTSAGQHLQTLGEGLGNFLLGLMNMMTAFGPLAETTADGFARMGEGFAEWSAGLSENEGFQKFVDYVNENMPKIRSIFSDAIQGVIHMFSAFGDSSSGMMTKLEGMMEGFLNWSKSLAESQGFKNFIDYVQTNGPVVVDTIGEIVTFIINLGKAAAPMGEYMLGLINGLFDFANGLLEAHPWLGKVAVAVGVFAGAFLAFLPVLVGFNSLTGGVITWLIKLGAQAGIWAVKMAASWIVAMGPIGWVTLAVVAIALLIFKYWDEISAWTKKTWSAISSAVTSVVDFIMAWIEKKFPAIYEVIQSAMKMIKEIISVYWEFAKSTFQNVLSFLKSLVKGDFQGMKDAISNQMKLAEETIAKIWGSVKSFLSETLAILLDKFGTMFAKIVSKVREKMAEAVAKVVEKVGEMPGKVLSFVDAMVSAGAGLVGGVIEGIKSKIAEGLGVIGGLATSLISRFKKDTDTHSPSRAFENIAKWFPPGIVKGIESTSGLAYKAVTTLSNGLTNAFNPQLALADMRASATLDTSISRADMGVVRKSFAAEVGDVDINQGDTVLQINSREFARWTADDIKKENERNERQQNVNKRGRN